MDYEWAGLRYTIYMLFERNMEYETTEWDVSKISKENEMSNFEMLAQFKTILNVHWSLHTDYLVLNLI